MASHVSRIKVIDSAKGGEAKPLHHSVYAIVYVPSWLRVRLQFDWSQTIDVIHNIEVMKEYFAASPFEERPIRAQRCAYVLKTLQIFGYKKDGQPRFSSLARTQLTSLRASLREYLADNPVVAWDWVVSWSECQAMAEAYPNEYIRLYRQLRSRYATKRKPKQELLYFITIMETVAMEKGLDMEHK